MIHESDKWSIIVNTIGLLFFIVALFIMLSSLSKEISIDTGILIIYSICHLIFWPIQMLYHYLITAENERDILRRIDRSSMLILVGGIFSPTIWLFIHSNAPILAISVIIILWILVIIATCLIMGLKNLSRKLAPILGFLMGIIGLITIGIGHGMGNMTASEQVYYILGVLCIVFGGVVYAIKKPDLKPNVFGFHEIYHSLNLIGAIFFHLLIV
jgi:hemolysin III